MQRKRKRHVKRHHNRSILSNEYTELTEQTSPKSSFDPCQSISPLNTGLSKQIVRCMDRNRTHIPLMVNRLE